MSGPRVVVAAALVAAARPVWADHGGGRTAGGGVDLAWLFLVGILVVVGLAAWAMFAPEREEPAEDQPSRTPPVS